MGALRTTSTSPLWPTEKLPALTRSSPSTSQSSVRETSVERQSASLAGRVEVSSAVLRRAASLEALAACRVFAAVLGPDYNAAHHDHFHLDRGGWGTCR